MPLESWLVVTVAAAFLLLGVAASPLAWVVLLNRRSRAERHVEQRFRELTGWLRTIQQRVEQCEVAAKGQPVRRKARPSWARLERPGWEPAESASLDARVATSSSSLAGHHEDPPLIAVPNLASTTHDRQAVLSTLAQRYSAVWSLADTGASPDVIARATGQPIGQIELILGLRRQIDGAKTTVPRATD